MVTPSGFEKDIDLAPPSRRTRGLLLDAARPIPASELSVGAANRLPAGVTWLPWGSPDSTTEGVYGVLDADPDPGDEVLLATYNKLPRELPAVQFQHAFLLWDSLQCTTLASSLEWLNDRIDVDFELMESAAFAAELESGANGTLGLKGDSTHVPARPQANTAVSIRLGIYSLEQHLASVLSDGVGMFHVTPGLLVLLAADYIVEWDGSVFRTATGHIVVGDAGFTGGVIPQGGTGAAAGTNWIYASGPVWTAIADGSTQELRETGEGQVALRTNKNRPLKEEHGLFVFDPGFVGAVKVTIA